MGYWTTQAGKLAKSVKNSCVVCRFLEKRTLGQTMGGIPKDQMISPAAWGHLELDLFGPFSCRSDTHKRSTCKIWGMILVDRNSGAVHSDIVMSYSAEDTLKTLRRFAALRGWPVAIYSDPGSQLVSSSGKLESWWLDMGKQLTDFASGSRFTWSISPANSPWRQGRAEVQIKTLKKLITLAIGTSRVTPVELQTILFESANLINQRPIGVHRSPKSDGTYRVLTPNCLLMGRTTNSVPDYQDLAMHLKKSERFQLIQQITSDFWARWSQEVTPEWVIRQRWHETGRNLRPGDVVLIHEKTNVLGTYKLGIVEAIDPSKDRLVRSCSVSYVVPNCNDPVGTYSGGRRVTVTRSIQKLSLILPVEEQTSALIVENNVVKLLEVQK